MTRASRDVSAPGRLLCLAAYLLTVVACGAVELGSHTNDVIVDKDGGAGEAGVAHEIGAACGTRGAPECAPGNVCIFPESAACGADDRGGGTCEPALRKCATTVSLVCGCDGKTYDNGCIANAGGVSVFHGGACVDGGAADASDAGGDGGVGASCGGFPPAVCQAGLDCIYAESEICGGADGMGTCQVRPTLCPTDVMLVCGCDGKQYNNSCIAHSKGVSVQHQGQCP